MMNVSVLCTQPVSLFRSMTLEQAERFAWEQEGDRQFPGLFTAVAIRA